MSLQRIFGVFLASTISLALGAQASCAAETITQTAAADRLDVAQLKKLEPGKEPVVLGLALGGGGARGAAEVGVLKVLDREGIKFDCISGTSIGAIVGGLYGMGARPEALQREFESGRLMHRFMTVPLTFRIIVAPFMYVPRILGSRAYDGLYKGNLFRKYLAEQTPEQERLIEKMPVKFAAVTLNALDGKPYMVRSGDIDYAMQASSAVPGLRKPVEIDDKLLCDGGVICNLPVKQCRELGANVVIAVNVDMPFRLEPKDEFRKPGSMTQRMITWALYDIDRVQEELADVVIHPDTSGISLVSRNRKEAKRAVLAGEKAAEEALPAIKKLLDAYGIKYGTKASASSAI